VTHSDVIVAPCKFYVCIDIISFDIKRRKPMLIHISPVLFFSGNKITLGTMIIFYLMVLYSLFAIFPEAQ
jgi:hypothetical protein